MRKSRFATEQIIGFIKQPEASTIKGRSIFRRPLQWIVARRRTGLD